MAKKKVFIIDLQGKERFKRLLADPSGKGLRSGLVSLKAQEAVGEHFTTGKEEVIIVLKGRGLINYGKNDKIKVKKGSFVYIPPDTCHNVKNTAKSPLQYVYVTNQLA